MAGVLLHVLKNAGNIRKCIRLNCQNKHSAWEAATYLLKLHTGEQVTLTNPLSTIRKGCTENQKCKCFPHLPTCWTECTEERDIGIEKVSEWSNGTVYFFFVRTGTEKSGPLLNLGQFFRNFPGWTKPIHSDLDGRNFRKFWLIRSHPLNKTEWSDSAVPESHI